MYTLLQIVLHGVSETLPIDEFDALGQSGGINGTVPSLEALLHRQREMLYGDGSGDNDLYG